MGNRTSSTKGYQHPNHLLHSFPQQNDNVRDIKGPDNSTNGQAESHKDEYLPYTTLYKAISPERPTVLGLDNLRDRSKLSITNFQDFLQRYSWTRSTIMVALSALTLLLTWNIFVVFWPDIARAVPAPQTPNISNGSSSGTNSIQAASSEYWLASITRQGKVAYGSGADYAVFRNVKDFGATGDGSTDDTEAINIAISSGSRCGQGCDSSTVKPALVYFPPGIYMVSAPIIQYYYTQLVGDALGLPTLKATADFQGMAVIDADPYAEGGINWYTNQNNFYRQIRNFVIDVTASPSGTGIHWQVAQATSLQNIRFEMTEGSNQQGIFMDNGSGGFMTDLTFNGGNYGAFLGSQQFTSRNMTFNNCKTAIFMNWNWAWTFKSLNINNCGIGIDMSNSVGDGINQTVGSVLVLDSKLTNTPKGVVTSYSESSTPETGGTLTLDNVDFTGSSIAVAGIDGSTVLGGNSVVASWGQGNVYNTAGGELSKRGSCDNPQPNSPIAPSPIPISTEQPVTDLPPSPPPSTSIPGVNSLSASPTIDIPITTDQPNADPSNTSSLSTSSFSTSSLSSSSLSTSSPSSSSPSTDSPILDEDDSSDDTPGNSGSFVKTRLQGPQTAPTKPGVLLNGGSLFERSRPQYETVPVSSFVSVKSAGAKGDGITDDSDAIQSVLDSARDDQIVYFDHGAYIVTKTIRVPKNIKITGEIWPLIMASGPNFQDQNNPIPVFQVGQPGDQGAVEMSDIIFETAGPAPGAILMEWNVAESSQGAAGLWDVHFRTGGSAGTRLQSDACAKNPEVVAPANPQCAAAFLSMHITTQASAYLENVWFWVADHELDLPDHGQINIYNGRGLLVESQGPVWLYGTASEHNTLYNYQFSNAKNIFMGLAQTESAYFQSNPNSLDPFKPSALFDDPDFSTCTTEACRKTWGLRVLNSEDIFVYGAGMYSFFENYGQDCLDTESCQENMVTVENSRSTWLYGLSTKASTNMINVDGAPAVLQKDNRDNFCSTVELFALA